MSQQPVSILYCFGHYVTIMLMTFMQHDVVLSMNVSPWPRI